MATGPRSATTPAGIRTFLLPYLGPSEQGRRFALVTRTRDWRLLLVRADLTEQEKRDGTMQEGQLMGPISGYNVSTLEDGRDAAEGATGADSSVNATTGSPSRYHRV
jgi:hypothetical protein